MPLNRGQGQTTRWYHLCFVPTSPDTSDDSDIESVVLTPSTPTPTSSTWQQLSPPSTSPPPLSSPPSPLASSEPQIDGRFLLPPPPPDFLRPLIQQQPQLSGASGRLLNIEVQQDGPQPTSLSHVFESDKSGFSMNAMYGLSRVRVSEIDKLSICPICMDEFKVCDQAYQLPCNHAYCSECILRWLNNHKTCPVCRLQLNGYSFDSINDNNGLESQLEILSLSPPPVVHNDLSSAWDFLQFPPSFIPDMENSTNDIDGSDSEPETLLSLQPLLPPPPPPLSYESPPYLTLGIEHSVSDNSDEADYDSACDEFGDSQVEVDSDSVCDELGDSQEDGASRNASDTQI